MKQIILNALVIILLSCYSCGSDDPVLSSEKQIISFNLKAEDHDFLETDVTATIDQTTGSIGFILPPESDVTKLIPDIEISTQATITPNNEVLQDFTSPITYTVTAEDGSTNSYTVSASIALKSDKAILSFQILETDNSIIKTDVEGVINEADHSISFKIPFNVDKSAITPKFTLSPGASSTPKSGEAQDFTEAVEYTITAEDGTSQVYEVGASYSESQAQVLSFSFLAADNEALFVDVIGEISTDNAINLEVPATTDITALKANVKLSTGAVSSIDFQINKDFTNQMNLDIEGQDLSKESFTISVTETDEKAVLLELAAANPDNTLNWNIETDISTWDQITVEGEKVISMELNYQAIRSIPKSIGKLVHLTILDISNDSDNPEPLTELTSEIGRLVKLKRLTIEGHQLATLPDEIGNLTDLEELYLFQGSLSSLPLTLFDLPNLLTLYLSGNKFRSLPEEIGNLPKLTRLELEGNQLVNLPTSIKNLTTLKNLDIGNNSIDGFPSDIFQLTNLQQLYLRGNGFESIPSGIGALTNLRYLILEDNNLTTLPVEIGNLSSLFGLWIANNNFTIIPAEICALNTNHGTLIYKDAGMSCEE